MPSSTTVSWSAVGNLTCTHYYNFYQQADPTTAVWAYKQTVAGTDQKTATITLPANCRVYNIKITNGNGAVGQGVTLYGAYVGSSGKQAIMNALNNKVKAAGWTGSESASMVFKWTGNPDKPYRTTSGTPSGSTHSYSQTKYFGAVSLQILYYTAEEIAAGAEVGDDILPEEYDPTISFIIEPYGPNRKRYGVAVAGAPTSESDTTPSFDCYIPTTFTNSVAMLLTSDKFIYQEPLWQDVMSFSNNYYSDDEAPLQYCSMNGSVYMRGIIRNSSTTWALNKSIFTLPEGYRPSYAVQKQCFLNTQAPRTGNKKGYCLIGIGTDGVVTFIHPCQWLNTNSITNTSYTDSVAFICMDMGFRK